MRNLLFTLLTLTMFVFASCTGGNTNAGKTTSFIGGTNGLVVAFEQDQPPVEVFDNDQLPFEVTVRVQNLGEADVKKEDLQVRITGIRAQEFGVSEADLKKNPSDDLSRTYKDSEGNTIDGATDYLTFSGLSFLGSLAGNQQFTIRADACYKYTTKATSLICITKDIMDTTYDKVCKVNEQKSIQNSGAPVQFANFKEMPRGKNKIQFSFDVTHPSNGNVFKTGSGCEFSTANERVVQVKVTTNLPGLSCSGWKEISAQSGLVTLVSGAPRTITCSQDAPSGSDFEQVVNLEAEYDYLSSVETRVLVKHAIE
jgi:hypothetical protein